MTTVEKEKPKEKTKGAAKLMTHDAFFKRCMFNLLVAIEFFKACLPKKLLQKLDLKTLKLEKSDFFATTLGYGICDLLYSVRYKNSSEYILLLAEHQSSPDPNMGLRLREYMIKIWDLYKITTPDKKIKFSTIIPMIFTGVFTKLQ